MYVSEFAPLTSPATAQTAAVPSLRGSGMSLNSLLELAKELYRPDLVAIIPSRIAALNMPSPQAVRVNMQWIDRRHPEWALQCLILMGALNYRLWEQAEEGRLTRFRFGGLQGTRALWGVFEKHWRQDAATFRSDLNRKPAQQLLAGMPDLPSRLAILEEVLTDFKLEDVAAQLYEDIRLCGQIRLEHAHALARAFPTAFSDPFLNKAQSLLSMFASHLETLGLVVSCAELTAFANDLTPQILHELGLVRYAESIATSIHLMEPIPSGSEEEHAIRSATLLACELIRQAKGSGLAASDYATWKTTSLAHGCNSHLTYTSHY